MAEEEEEEEEAAMNSSQLAMVNDLQSGNNNLLVDDEAPVARCPLSVTLEGDVCRRSSPMRENGSLLEQIATNW